MKTKTFIISAIFLMMNIMIIAQHSEPIVKTFSTVNATNLQVSISPGNITLSTWNKNEIRIEVISKSEYEVKHLVSKKTNSKIKFDLELECCSKNNITVNIKAPSKFRFDLQTTGGNINITNNISGKLVAETEGGNVNFYNVKGNVDVITHGGNIKGGNIEGKINFLSHGGNIDLENVKNGEANIVTHGGNINVGSVSSNLSAVTHGGHINISDVGGNAKAVSYGGHINMEKVSGSAIMETNGGHLNLRSASGNVVAKTLGGHINLQNITGNIIASTHGGNIYAELSPGKNTQSSLETSSGNIELKIPPSAEASINVSVENAHRHEDGNKYIKSAFPSSRFNIDEDDGDINATYILNGGGSKISLNCSNGKVTIWKWNR
ncbi:MAG: hypothetical protein V3V16_13415 [Melioribacteraceae bacterium]